MADSITSVTHQSWGSRMRRSMRGMIYGLIFGVAGISILFWNEGNYVRQHKALNEGFKIVADVPLSPIDPINEGKLVHLIGDAVTPVDMNDPLFGVTLPNALKLKRNVEMYQWVQSDSVSSETKHTGGSSTTSTTRTYNKEWKSDLVDSSTFTQPTGHENPRAMVYTAISFRADPIMLGDFTVSAAITDLMQWWRPIVIAPAVSDIPGATTQSMAKASNNNGFYFGENSNFPDIGDTRVTFDVVPEQTISVVARQTSGSLSAYTVKNGGSVLLVQAGPHDAAEMFMHANEELTIQTWIYRGVGFVLVFLMFLMLARPMEVFADVIPCVGNLVGAGSCCVAFVIAAAVSIVVIALAWLVYRPIFSLLLLSAVGGLLYVLHVRSRNVRNKKEYIPTATVLEEGHHELQDLSFMETVAVATAVEMECVPQRNSQFGKLAHTQVTSL